MSTYNPPPVTYNRPYGANQLNQPDTTTTTTTTKKKGTPNQIPNWAFWSLVAFAVLLGIAVAVLWYYLQTCRKAVFHPTCPTVLPQTCYKAGTPQCVVACNTDADCPTGETCNTSNNTCS